MAGNDYLFEVTGWKPSEGKRPRYYLTQLSQAVVAILEHYLNDRPPSEISSQVLFDEVKTLKKEIAIIKASLVEAGAKSLAPTMTSEVVIFPTERMEIQYIDQEAQDGLTKSELCALP